MASFLLSCRVLGRQVEFSLMQYVINKAKGEGIKTIYASFMPTKKNKPSEKFLLDCGFSIKSIEKSIQKYALDLSSAKEKELLVKVNEWKP